MRWRWHGLLGCASPPEPPAAHEGRTGGRGGERDYLVTTCCVLRQDFAGACASGAGVLGTTAGVAGGAVVAGAVVLTVPFTASFAFGPMVPRAMRVALAFAVAAAFCAGVRTTFLRGVNPKSASLGLAEPKAPITRALRSRMTSSALRLSAS